jgi:hypothetical protein
LPNYEEEDDSCSSTGPGKIAAVDQAVCAGRNVMMHDPMCLFRFEERASLLP